MYIAMRQVYVAGINRGSRNSISLSATVLYTGFITAAELVFCRDTVYGGANDKIVATAVHIHKYACNSNTLISCSASDGRRRGSHIYFLEVL